jgi:hypothetical protein
MKKFIILLVFNTMFFQFEGQSQNYSILMNLVNIDTLTKTVRDLSGEDSVSIYGLKTRISERKSNDGSNKAAEYIKQKLESYSLEVNVQNYSQSGRNIYSIQKGKSDSLVMFCAHYDSVTDYCADDNISGTASVLEAARLLSDSCFEYSIIYALWDEEEKGLVGSRYFASNLNNLGYKIKKVLNFDMVAFDNDGDKNFEIHINENPLSKQISEDLLRIVSNENLNLVGFIKNPGTGASDHASFWPFEIGGCLVIEEYYGGDFNQYYHSPNDRIGKFNIPYFHEMAKLGVMTIADIAQSCNTSSLNYDNEIDILSVFPNPVKENLSVTINNCATTDIFIYDLFGKLQYRKTFQNKFEIDMKDFIKGIYLIKIQNDNKSVIRKIIKMN